MYKLFGCTYYNALCCYEQIQRSVDLLLIVAHVLYVVFADDFISSALVSIEIYIPAIVLTAFFVYLLPKIIQKIKSKNFRIGCVFACHIFLILFPLVPRILVFRVGWDFQMLIVLVIAPLLILHLVLYLNRYQFPTEIFYNEEIVASAIVMNLVFLVATIRFAYKLTSGWDLAAIIIVQVIFTPITFIANLDFLLILGEQRVFFPGSNLVSIQPVDKETGAQDKQHRPPHKLSLRTLDARNRFHGDQCQIIETSQVVGQRFEERIPSKIKCHTRRFTGRTVGFDKRRWKNVVPGDCRVWRSSVDFEAHNTRISFFRVVAAKCSSSHLKKKTHENLELFCKM
ncbi:hypothetical protein B9Z55_023115 [Caenorhabditis nigoni]|uniref:Uncharacterized protein n=1 Tax=Caenorhabditis nigoni TaxID=1611254 RepID=A0A2G5SN57_9PELO|nr:hypothetical protein B9Z55_023115 [Caenorhabditis nigoni]